MRACSGHGRVGSLRLASGLEFETPSLLMITRRGLPVVIPPEMLMDLHPDSRACQFTPMHFLEDPLAAVVAKAGGVHKLASLTGFAMVAVARDSLGNEIAGEEASNLGASFETSSGRRIVGLEKYMEVVNACKPDLWVSLPDEVPHWVPEKRNRESVDHTSQWLDHCLSLQHAEHGNRCLGVVVGAGSLEERARSAEQAATRNVAGFSLAGFGLGEDVAQRGFHLEVAIAKLPNDKLRHVCGLGSPEEVLQAVGAGIDLLDSTYPYMLTKECLAMTFPLKMEVPLRNADRDMQPTPDHGVASGFSLAKVNLRSATYGIDETPLVTGCKCYTCKRHTKVYINQLLNSNETLAQTLLEIHNTYHYLEFFKAIRESIKADKFHEFRTWFTSQRQELGVLSLGNIPRVVSCN